MKKLFILLVALGLAYAAFGEPDLIYFPTLNDAPTSGATVVTVTNNGGFVNGYVKGVVIKPASTSNLTLWVSTVSSGIGAEQVIYSNAAHSGTGVYYVAVNEATRAGTQTNSTAKMPLVQAKIKVSATLSCTILGGSNDIDVIVIMDKAE